MRHGLLAGVICSLAPMAGAGEFRLGLPLDCVLGETCYIQQFQDRDPGPDARDFTCGPLTYDGHSGTDFAVPTLADMTRGVAVVAAAPGVVRGVRDEMPDIMANQPNAPDLNGRDCGNGVLIAHADGWETQYCHLRLGSVAVVPGQPVDAGDLLGQVGLSGNTEFPHLHLSVRRNGTAVDPFDPNASATCDSDPQDALWSDQVAYVPGGWIGAGFSPAVPDYDAIKAGTASVALDGDPPAMVLWGFAFGTRQGDTVLIQIDGPIGPVHQARIPLDRTQAQMFRASGLRRPADGWAAGTYVGTIRLIRDRQVISERTLTTELP